MSHRKFRRYPRDSPQAAGRILATAVLANGEPLLYGHDFEVRPRRGIAATG